MDKPGGVFRLLFNALCDFARVEAHLAEARGVTVSGTPIVVVDLRRLTMGLTVKQDDGTVQEICSRPGNANLGDLVARFLEDGLRRQAPDVAQGATARHTSGAETFALVAVLDGGTPRIACVLASAADPREQVQIFTAMQDEWAVGGQVH